MSDLTKSSPNLAALDINLHNALVELNKILENQAKIDKLYKRNGKRVSRGNNHVVPSSWSINSRTSVT